MKAEIAERLGRGEGKEQILAAFTARYGEKVLSAPTFRGFNWFAWVTPFAAVLAAGAGAGRRRSGAACGRRPLRRRRHRRARRRGDRRCARGSQRELDELDRE